MYCTVRVRTGTGTFELVRLNYRYKYVRIVQVPVLGKPKVVLYDTCYKYLFWYRYSTYVL